MATVKEIRKMTGLSQAAFCELYKIPRRTLEDWESGKYAPTDYFVSLLERVVREDTKHEGFKCYNNQTMYEMGYIYHGLINTLNKKGTGPYPNPEIFPYKCIVLILPMVISLGIDKNLEARLAALMDMFEIDDNDKMLSTPSPIETRMAWYRGYMDYEKELYKS